MPPTYPRKRVIFIYHHLSLYVHLPYKMDGIIRSVSRVVTIEDAQTMVDAFMYRHSLDTGQLRYKGESFNSLRAELQYYRQPMWSDAMPALESPWGLYNPQLPPNRVPMKKEPHLFNPAARTFNPKESFIFQTPK